MGNAESTSSRGRDRRKRSSSRHRSSSGSKGKHGNISSRAKETLGEGVRELQANISRLASQKLDDQDHPAAQFIDQLCSPYLGSKRNGPTSSFYSEDVSDDESASDYDDEEDDEDEYDIEDETIATEEERRNLRNKKRAEKRRVKEAAVRRSARNARRHNLDDRSSYSMEDGESEKDRQNDVSSVDDDRHASFSAMEDSLIHSKHQQPLASALAKKCYFTKQSIGNQTQHYEGLTLTGSVILMLAAAMKLKGCPTICDEDLRRVEQNYPDQFSRLPDELLLSSGWRRISKFCHFSDKPIPDGVPFFHSRERLHTSGGYYFLLASAVGMIRPIDVEPLNRDTLVLLETDYPDACDKAPRELVEDPTQWTLVDKFCFFSGGPINVEEDVYYQADFDGNSIFMLAFLSPSLTPTELYKLELPEGLKSVDAVEEVEAVYDLTGRDLEDLKLYHLGPCRALPEYILQPEAWTKVLPPHFIAAREEALLRAMEYEQAHGLTGEGHFHDIHYDSIDHGTQGSTAYTDQTNGGYGFQNNYEVHDDFARHDGLGTFDQEQSMLTGLRGISHIDGTEEYIPQMDVQYSDSMQYTADSNHFNNPHMHGASPANGSSAFARMPYYSEDYDEPDAPLDEASAAQYQRGARMDPPEDEPPSLSKHDEASYALNGEMSLSMSHDQSFEQQEYQHRSLQYDHYQNGIHANFERTEDGEKHYLDMESNDYAANESDYREMDDNGLMSNSGLEGFDGQSRSMSPEKSVLSQPRSNDLPPASPRSDLYASSAAPNVVRPARRHSTNALSPTSTNDSGEPGSTLRTVDSESNGTWASGSDFTGDSSMWTDGSALPPDRSARRALILQMAKARMKKDTPEKLCQEEKKTDSHNADTSDFDLTVDLD